MNDQVADRQVKRVRFPLSPLVGESLPGFIARTVAWNFLERPTTILRSLGLPRGHDLSEVVAPRVDYVAAALGVPARELAKMLTVASEDGSERTYFGTSIRTRRLNHQRRRISPASLRESPHHRVNWMVDAVSWCPESWEHLISTCPACSAPLGWIKCSGVDVCEHCEQDLKPAASTTVDPSLRPALSIFSDLVSPHADKRLAASAVVPGPFRDLKPTSIFEAAVSMARCSGETSTAQTPTPLSDGDLARGVDMLLAYPTSFEKLSSNNTANLKLDDFFARLSRQDMSYDKQLVAVISAVIDEHEPVRHAPSRFVAQRSRWGMLSLRETALSLRVENKTAARLAEAGYFTGSRVRGTDRRHQWLDAESVERARVRLSSPLSATNFAHRYGLPLRGLAQLVSLGALRLNRDPLVNLATPSLQLQAAMARRLVLRAQAALCSSSSDGPAITLVEALHGVGAQEKPWGPIIQGLLRGKLRHGLARQLGRPFRFDEITITSQLARDLARGHYPELLETPPWPIEFDPYADFNRVEVERHLNCFPRDVSWLLDRGHLRPGSAEGRVYPRAQVEELGKVLISSREISWRWRVSPGLRDSLGREHGVERVLGPFWSREAVVRHFSRLP